MPKQGGGGDITLDRALPNNVEAERFILGAIFLDNTTLNQAAEQLKPDDFFLVSHRRIFEKMIGLFELGRGIDPITLQEELRRAAELELVGGPAYIASLFDGVPRFSNIENYVKIVKGKSMLRRLIVASNQIMAKAFDDEDEPEQILDEAERLILSIAEDRIKQGFIHIGDVAAKQLSVIEESAGREQMVTGIGTGFSDLDYMTSGLQRGDLIIIAARPSMGKCLAADSEITLSDGSVRTIEELYHSRSGELFTLGENFKFSLTQPSAYIDDGVKPVYRVTTRLGRSITTTLSHPYLTIGGWRKLSELKVGDSIAVPRRIDLFGVETLDERKVKLLAYLIGDGNLTNSTPSFTNTNPRLQQDFSEAVGCFSGLKVRARVDGERAPSFYVAGDAEFVRDSRKDFAFQLDGLLSMRGAGVALANQPNVTPSLASQWRHGVCAPRVDALESLGHWIGADVDELAPNWRTSIRRQSQNPLTLWLEELGLWGLGAHHKFIPDLVFRLARKLVALFLNRLFATDGWVALTEGQAPQLGYATASEKLARQVQHLLLRFGIIAKLRERNVPYKQGTRRAFQLDITHGDSIRTFASEIGIFGKEDRLSGALTRLSTAQTRNHCDLIPVEIWKELAELKANQSWSSLAQQAGLKGHSNIHAGRLSLSRERLKALSEALGDQRLSGLAESDLYWDEIIEIQYQGERQVYDLTIPETHNFVANDICVHNTAFSLNIAQNAATMIQHHGEKAVVGVFSLEMSNEQLVNRLLCSQARVDAHRLRSGYLSKDEWRRLAIGVGELSEALIYLDDTPGVSTLEMRAKARRLKNEQKRIDLIIVDYLQLMTGRGRNESRQQEVSQISRELKMLAKELNVPLIALSQLSRAPETRTGNHKPQLSDLRESGSIEQDADVVMFIYREEVYKPETEKQNIAEIIIGKQRNGPIGSVELIFLKQLTRFEDKFRDQVSE